MNGLNGLNGLNGYEKYGGLNDEYFGAKAGSIVSAFDAFPKSKPQYVTRTSGGGKWTVFTIVLSLILVWSELARWWRGSEEHTFAVEKGVGHAMQINLDLVIRMHCVDVDVNVQDAAGDRILAGQMLRREQTMWAHWVDAKGMHKLRARSPDGKVVTGAGWQTLDTAQAVYGYGTPDNHGIERNDWYDEEGFGEEHVHDIVAAGRKKAKWGKTPRLNGQGDSCRIFGSLELNKVQGDFHITARGHGYMDVGHEHLDHSAFNFSHIISELSFGPFYPSLVNPLDRTVNVATAHFHKFQYFMSVVPTIYSVGPTPSRRGSARSGADDYDVTEAGDATHRGTSRNTIFTNQYAVTEQSAEISEQNIPGIFFKYDIEPILLHVQETRDGLLSFTIKIVNILSGVVVAAHWGFTLSEWLKEVIGRKRRGGRSVDGMLGGKGALSGFGLHGEHDD